MIPLNNKNLFGIRITEKNVICFITIISGITITFGFLNIIILYAILAFELLLLTPLLLLRIKETVGTISLIQLSWTVSTFFIALNMRHFDFLVFYYVLNALLGLMILICINTDTSELVYKYFKCFIALGVFSALTIFLEIISRSSIISIYKLLAPNELNEIYIFLKQGRYLGITNYVWYTSFFLVLAGGYILSKYSSAKRQKKLVYIVFLIILYSASFFTGSRSSLLIFPLLALCFFGGKNRIWYFLVIALLFLIIYFVIINSDLSFRIIKTLQNLFNNVLSGNVIDETRSNLKYLASSLFNSHKLLGVGWYQFRYFAFEKTSKYFHTHNMYYQLLAENGIIGSIIIVFPWIVTFIRNINYIVKYRSYSACKTYKIVRYCLYIQTYLYIASLAHVTIYDSRTMLFFYIICGMSLQCTKVKPSVFDNKVEAC